MFTSHSLDTSPRADSIRDILSASLAAADPTNAIRASLTRHAKWIRDARRVFLLAVGKAGLRMAEAALPLLDFNLAGGLVITKHASRVTIGRVPVLEADHPIPGARSLAAGQRVLRLLSNLHPDDLLVCLFSGGASALMTAPIEGLSLGDLQSLTSSMLSSGASITELNALRRRLDRLKGGGVARLAAPARVLSLILSDVVGDQLDIIASGPTVADTTSQEEVEAILSRYSPGVRLPASVWEALCTGEPIANSLYGVRNILVGSNTLALRTARGQALRSGFRTRIVNSRLQGESRDVGRALAQTLCRARTRPLCLLAGGETTVTVTGKGCGGRNQEFALAAALELDRVPDVMFITFATDGDDGMTGAAGAVVTGDTLSRARSLGLNAQDFLHRNDSNSFFSALGDALVTGPTGTNVNDLALMFRF